MPRNAVKTVPIEPLPDCIAYKTQCRGSEIRRLRMEKKLSQEKLGELVGLPQSRISEIEREKIPVPTKTLAKFAYILGTTLENIARGLFDLKRSPSNQCIMAKQTVVRGILEESFALDSDIRQFVLEEWSDPIWMSLPRLSRSEERALWHYLAAERWVTLYPDGRAILRRSNL
ncbi:MAG: helix-turn-helix transcriptional regulator, partial [Roseobacter sp.]